MRCVIDCRYLRGRPSGIGAYVQGFATRLPRLAPHDQFHYWAHGEGPAAISSAANVSQERVAGGPNSLGTLLWPARLADLRGADVFHSPHNVLGRGIDCPTIVTVHDVMWLDDPRLCEGDWVLRAGKRWFYRGGIWHALRHATRILTVSAASRNGILRWAPQLRDRVHVAHCALEPEFVASAQVRVDRELINGLLGFENPYYLMVGLDQPSKGHAVGLAALASLDRPEARMVLLQRRGTSRRLPQLARELDIADRVSWVGARDQADLIGLMQHAEALLQPSLAEGFGIPVLEALAAGCPVVASDIPALREVAGEAALFFEPGNALGIVAALGVLRREPSLAMELRERGRERVRAFSWDATARDVLDVYRAAAERR